MHEDEFTRWARSELERLDCEEKREKRRKNLEAQKMIMAERYFNAPTLNINGNIIGGKSISTREP
jgi:glutaredoxin